MKIKRFILSILSTFSIIPSLLSYLNNFFNIFNNKLIISIITLIVFILIYLLFNSIHKLSKKNNILCYIITFILIILYSYMIKSNMSLVFGSIYNIFISIIKYIGSYYLIKEIIYYIDIFFKKEYKYSNKLISIFNNHPFKYSFIILFIVFGIYLIGYYPGILNYDNANQIKEVLGLHTRYLDAINPVVGSTLTNFNPIIHTLLLGNSFKLGVLINNVNLGLFIYTFSQMLIVILIYSYVISYLNKLTSRPLYSIITLILLCIIPIFPFYSITNVKDTLYTSFLLLLSLKLYEYTIKEYSYKDYIHFITISILVCLFRNNGIFIVIPSIVFMLYKNKKNIIILISTMLLFNLSFNNILLPYFKVSNTSIREALSIPIQQIARLVKYHDEDIKYKDKVIINNILPYKKISNLYNEDLADPVKNKFNKDYTNEDLVNFFKVWSKYLVKYPITYIDATLNNISGYFNPFEYDFKVYHKLNNKLPEAGYDYHYNDLDWLRNTLYNYTIFLDITPLGLLSNMGVLSWLSMYLFINIINKKKYYIFMLPNIISILFCVLSPANTYYRYMYPTLVMIISLLPLYKYIFENKKG